LKGKKTREDTAAHPDALPDEGNINTRRTCFSREGIGRHAAKLTVRPRASSRLKPVLLKGYRVHPVGPALERWWSCGTGFSRKGVGCHAAKLTVRPRASSRLKPVLLKSYRADPVGPALERGWFCGTGIGTLVVLWDRL
jgi:hypothetical protein